MDKILNAEFRNQLYKNLMEAGYDKNEAQTIVGKKYLVSLKAETAEKINALSKCLENGEFATRLDDKWLNDFNHSMEEIGKMNDFLEKNNVK